MALHCWQQLGRLRQRDAGGGLRSSGGIPRVRRRRHRRQTDCVDDIENADDGVAFRQRGVGARARRGSRGGRRRLVAHSGHPARLSGVCRVRLGSALLVLLPRARQSQAPAQGQKVTAGGAAGRVRCPRAAPGAPAEEQEALQRERPRLRLTDQCVPRDDFQIITPLVIYYAVQQLQRSFLIVCFVLLVLNKELSYLRVVY